MTANKPKQNSWLKRQLRSTRRAVKALERWLKSHSLPGSCHNHRRTAMYDQIAQAHPKLQRARVWCDTCNRTVKVNVSTCLQHGWPKCCGYTMTLDSPEERAAAVEQAGEKQ